jgi:hypothetical protein
VNRPISRQYADTMDALVERGVFDHFFDVERLMRAVEVSDAEVHYAPRRSN